MTCRLNALRTLKPAQREALYLKGVGYSYHEIAALSRVAHVASVQACSRER